MGLLWQWVIQTWSVVLEAAPWLVAGFGLAGVIHVLVPAERVTRHLGKPGLADVVKASLMGMPLPLCSCSVIPLASSIRRHGASRGATASFLISTPETGVDSFAVSYALLGPFLAIIRPVAAFVTALVAGCAINRFDPHPADGQLPDDQTAPSCCHHAGGAAPSRPGRLIDRAKAAVGYGFGEMFEDLGHWLLLGFVLAGLVSALVPPGFLAEHVGTGVGVMFLMLVAGLPLYVCATSSTPLAAALIAKGLSPGAALVFLLVGPATNIATMVVVARDLGRRSLVLYLLSIATVAVLFGLGTDRLLGTAMAPGGATLSHVHARAAWAAWPFAVALALLILNGLRRRLRQGRTPRHG